jgi:hypothetical protein
MIVFSSPRDVEVVESDVTWTEQRVEEIVGHGRVVRVVHIFPCARH